MSTFYLKYRPQKIKELDLSEIREQLSQTLSSEKIPHAFLFTGPKGLGKTSAARIVAKSINCETRKTQKQTPKTRKNFEPCNKCQICKGITAGTLLDLIEIDAASNRGIDDIRELRERIKLSPSQAKKKVYVIDEAHMLTMPAFNALLKTLEEPPEHALFILCTTKPEKLPGTIISRCQRFNFRLAKPREIVRALKRIVKGEKLKVKDEVLDLIAKRAEGSFRDAVKVLQQLSFGGRNISLKKTEDFFGRELVWANDILKLLAEKSIPQALQAVNKAVKNGVDLKVLIAEILEILRKVLLRKYQVLDEEIEEYGLEINQIKKLINLFDKAGRELKGTVIPQLPLELAIIEYCNIQNTHLTHSTDSRQAYQKSQPKVDHPLDEKTSKLKNNRDLEEMWQEVLKAIKKDNHSLVALLKSTRPRKIKGKKMFVEVFYKFHKDKLEVDDNVGLVEKRIEQVFGKLLKIEYILSIK